MKGLGQSLSPIKVDINTAGKKKNTYIAHGTGWRKKPTPLSIAVIHHFQSTYFPVGSIKLCLHFIVAPFRVLVVHHKSTYLPTATRSLLNRHKVNKFVQVDWTFHHAHQSGSDTEWFIPEKCAKDRDGILIRWYPRVIWPIVFYCGAYQKCALLKIRHFIIKLTTGNITVCFYYSVQKKFLNETFCIFVV